MNENEEFEFRLRMEKEAAQAVPEKPMPSTSRVALQSAAKGAASVPDMFLGIPANLFNLGSAGVGYAAGELGRPDIASRMPIAGPAFTQPTRTLLEQTGAISPEFEPQTGGQRILGRALETAPQFALSPASGMKQLGANLATGAASGLVSGAVKEATGSELAAGAAGMLTPFAIKGAVGVRTSKLEPVTGETLKEAREAGYVVPPSLVKPTVTATTLEKIAGKASVSQEASMRNQTVTNNLAAKAIGLKEGTPLTEAAIAGVKSKAGAVFDKIDELRPTISMPWFPRFHETDLGKQLQKARADATQLWNDNKRTPHEATREAARRMDTLADSLEDDIERIAKATGQPTLLKELQDARQLYAKVSDVERALIPGTGNISAAALGNQLKRKKLTGELKVIGEFGKAFPRESRNAPSVPSPSVSGTDAMAAGLLGTIGYGASGAPGLIAAGLPLLRSPARNRVLGNTIQNRLVAPPKPFEEVLFQSALAGPG
jgi:hypothetical protein